jgi:hypothetical protein
MPSRRLCVTAAAPLLILVFVAHAACAHETSSRTLQQQLATVDEGGRHAALQQLWRTPLALQSPETSRLFRSGFKHELQGRNWRRLALKLATPGSNVTVAVFGGSVTVGHYPSCDNSSWVEEAWHWMEAAFPSANFNFVHLGHGATSANVASLCYYHDLPADADLVLVEYSLNGVSHVVQQCSRLTRLQ